jgi:hypothetical protein
LPWIRQAGFGGKIAQECAHLIACRVAIDDDDAKTFQLIGSWQQSYDHFFQRNKPEVCIFKKIKFR